MRRGLLILAAFVAIAAAGYGLYYRAATASARAMLARPESPMEWLRGEFHLSDAQFGRVRQLHEAYAPRCNRMCERIQAAEARVNALLATHDATVTPEVETALQNLAAVREACTEAMLAHACAVAKEMPPPDGLRYLQMMKGRVLAPGLPEQTLVSKAGR